MKKILNHSKAGKGAQDYLTKSFKENQKKFSNQQEELKKEEADLLGKKNVLSKEDYTKKADSLRKKVIDYQSARRAAVDKIAKQRKEAREDLLNQINPILETYTKENNITLILDKKNLIMGDSDLDITNTIIEKLNTKLPSIKIN